ncbi:putative F0F1-ATPase subunit (Ca2+/Mg2+ transporter) [Desulfosoma caldarium]|uniref:Putative F0F1-ATPase subunit (Ca2+/Mg2+ transporter) n=2 Tax=Desulfosoma caldarium TaxID=610254 RepID=A0A3N1ULK1_9BACT|nr:putative F0F1-ATPase subunit (Ca2+/Mg2+ transporter) [Desulfosoma caldarium]
MFRKKPNRLLCLFDTIVGLLPREDRGVEGDKTAQADTKKNISQSDGHLLREYVAMAKVFKRKGTGRGVVKDFHKKRDTLESLVLVTQVGLTMAGSILFCLLVGYYLDKWLGTRYIFLVIFIVLGIVGGAVTVYRQIMGLPKK